MFIVYYHNVLDTSLDKFDKRCSRINVESFAQQMQYFATHFNPISLETMLSQLSVGNPDKKGVVITFDDAYYGVFAHAAPVLKRFNIPATVFVVTNHVRSGDSAPLLHFDEIEVAFRLTKLKAINLDFLNGEVVPIDSKKVRVACMKSVKRKLKLLPEHQRESCHRILLNRLKISQEEALAYGQTQEKFQTMSWDEIRSLMDGEWTIGAHTRSHRTLSQLSDADLEREIHGSLEDLQRELGLTEIPFAYPYGEKEHIGLKAPELVQQAGYSCGLTTQPGRNSLSVDNFLLHRMTYTELGLAHDLAKN
ncbi:MAG: polysaccharide deacetylase family protein [Xenococcus sp. MO_188.B8]|nr:polysaccharide deacetylase family protein [Xenococcus sp. MO_188.B8]